MSKYTIAMTSIKSSEGFNVFFTLLIIKPEKSSIIFFSFVLIYAQQLLKNKQTKNKMVMVI